MANRYIYIYFSFRLYFNSFSFLNNENYILYDLFFRQKRHISDRSSHSGIHAEINILEVINILTKTFEIFTCFNFFLNCILS